ncbi:MAG: GNAT family N-acetyltransferase [Lachnospiraceae bacterium]|nr:GNAT family N-acetyltransferase [Lachnospiraceae bacterium]
MQLTGIGEQNIDCFKALLPQSYDLNDIMVGAIGYGKAVGAASFSLVGSSIYMDHIFVDPDFRRKGVGSEMIKSFAAEMKKIVVGALHTDYYENSEGIRPFLEHLGFVSEADGEVFSVPIESFYGSDALNKVTAKDSKNKLIPLGKLTTKQMDKVAQKLEESGTDPHMVHDGSMDDELSLVSFDVKTGEPDGCIFCVRREDVITVSFLGSFQNDPRDLMTIVAGLKSVAEDEGITTGRLQFVSMDEKIRDFVKKLAKKPEDLKSEGAMYSAVLAL